MSAEPLVAEIARRAALPLEQALALPPESYRSEALLAREIDCVFRREWICLGREDEIPEPGDWMAVEIAGDPLLAVRGADGRVRVLANACRHRFAQLVEGRGRAKSLQCPYHAWTYDLEGRLRGAPFMDGRDVSSCRLPEIRSESWNGFLYANLDDAAPPLAPRLAGLTDRFAKHRVAEMRTVVGGEETWDANWKAIAENAMESYHVFQGHRTTLDPIFPTARLDIRAGAPGYNLHSSPMREGASFPGTGEDALRWNPDLPADQSRTLWLATVYPAHVVVVAPATFLNLHVQPEGPARSRVRWSFGQLAPVAATPEGDAYRDAVRQGSEAINAEDRALVAAVQRGAASSRAASGRLSHLERPVWEFIGYLSKRLAN
jgi:phenylpropionate dioxygenase-like ring-hydroxylating dioxygenase large terminal subunit